MTHIAGRDAVYAVHDVHDVHNVYAAEVMQA